MRYIFVLLLLITAYAVFADIGVTYHFESGKLVLEVGEEGEWFLSYDGSDVSFSKTVMIPWKKGRVDWIEIKNKEETLQKKVLIVGVHDLPPKVELEFPKVVGLGEYCLEVKAVDDWDEPSKIDIGVSLDGSPVEDRCIDTFFLKNGEHVFRVKAVDTYGNTKIKEQRFEVDVAFPSVPEYNLKPDTILFKKPADIYMLYPERVGYLRGTVVLSRDKGKIMRAVDDAGNLGEVFVVPPSPSDLMAVSKKTAITSITKNYLLLKGGSPYPIVGKVVLPSNMSLVLGSDVTLNLLAGQLIIKGVFMNIEKGALISGGSLVVEKEARLYLQNMEISSDLIVNGGKVIYLKGIKGLSDLSFSGVKWAVLEDMKLNSFSCDSCYGVFLVNSEINSLVVDNAREVMIERGTYDKIEIGDFTKAFFFSTSATEVTLKTLSKVMVLDCSFKKVFVDSASTLDMRGGSLGDVKISGYSLVETFGTDVYGQVTTIRSLFNKR